LSYELSDNIKLVLVDDDVIWPTTMDGRFRLITQKQEHNVLGKGEHPATEDEMIDGVLNRSLASRWRSRTNEKRKTPNHFSIESPSVKEVHVKVGGVWIRFK
jgi:hypothetical protein